MAEDVEKASSEKQLSNRARSKYITNDLAQKMVSINEGLKPKEETFIIKNLRNSHPELFEDRPHWISYYDTISNKMVRKRSTWKKYYFRSWHCAEILEQRDQTLTSKYCGLKSCIVCSRIRTARSINNYMPALDEIENTYFMTLTVKNCTGDQLGATIQKMMRTFQNIRKDLKKRKGATFIGLRKLEVTYNPRDKEYHPHFHLIIDDDWTAREIISTWVNRWKEDAVLEAQDLRPCGVRRDKDKYWSNVDPKSSMMELFKYFTKVYTNKVAYLYPLQVIMENTQRKRTFQNYGMTVKSESEELDDLESESFDHLVPAENIWKWFEQDWVSSDGELLTEYVPSEVIEELLTRYR